MSHFNSEVCSDEELLEELRKLGYDDVSPHVIDSMKKDLAGYIEESPISEYEVNSVSNRQSHVTESNRPKGMSRKTKTKSRSQNVHASNPREDNFSDGAISEFKNSKVRNKSYISHEQLNTVDESFSDTPAYLQKSNKVKNKLNNNFNSTDSHASKSDFGKEMDSLETRPKYLVNDNSSKHGHSTNKNSISPKSVRKNMNKVKKTNKAKEETSYATDNNNFNDTSFKHDYSNNKNSQKSPNKNKPNKTDLKNNEDFSDTNPTDTLDSYANTTSSSFNSDVKTMKRKVLRRRNGQSIITEEILEVPSLFETSYPADSDSSPNNNKCISNDDLSPKSNSSTGSVAAISPETCLKSSVSSVSLIARTSLKVQNSRKKKSDPVAMYNYYKKFWNSYKPPGENTHDKLRWAVRDRMLEYNM